MRAIVRAIDYIESKLGHLRYEMDHGNNALKWLAPIRTALRKMGVGVFLRSVRASGGVEATEKRNAYIACYGQHTEELKKLSEILEDDFSKYTLKNVVEFRKTYDRSLLKDVYVGSQYFQKDIFGPVKDEVFIDGGAYIGETVESFIRKYSGGGIQKNLYVGT